ncbi:hypothetical protein HDU97_002539 [Phlyctochytrium planicorne]|nr:hypothetical protein HDU97_002539 [Phlyctochytrium planicorne]
MPSINFTFSSPTVDGKKVVVTGGFDDWKQSVEMESVTDGIYGAKVDVNAKPGEKVYFKFVVDGVWQIDSTQAFEKDEGGNENNVWIAPEEPVVVAAPIPAPAPTEPAAVPASVTVPAVAETPAPVATPAPEKEVAAPAPVTTPTPAPVPTRVAAAAPVATPAKVVKEKTSGFFKKSPTKAAKTKTSVPDLAAAPTPSTAAAVPTPAAADEPSNLPRDSTVTVNPEAIASTAVKAELVVKQEASAAQAPASAAVDDVIATKLANAAAELNAESTNAAAVAEEIAGAAGGKAKKNKKKKNNGKCAVM